MVTVVMSVATIILAQVERFVTVRMEVHATSHVNVPVRERFVALEMSTNAMVVIITDILRVLVVVVEALV